MVCLGKYPDRSTFDRKVFPLKSKLEWGQIPFVIQQGTASYHKKKKNLIFALFQ